MALFEDLEISSMDLPRKSKILAEGLENLLWSDFSSFEQKSMISAATKARKQDCWQNRRIQGLVPRPRVEMSFDKDTFLFGHHSHQVDRRSNLGPTLSPMWSFKVRGT